MKNIKLNIENFKAEKIDRNQQKSIRGGDDITIVSTVVSTAKASSTDIDPVKGGTGSVG